MPNRDLISSVPAGLRPQATSRRVERESIATTRFRVVGGPTMTTRLPTMIHPGLAAADLRQRRIASGQNRQVRDRGQLFRFALESGSTVGGAYMVHRRPERDGYPQ